MLPGSLLCNRRRHNLSVVVGRVIRQLGCIIVCSLDGDRRGLGSLVRLSAGRDANSAGSQRGLTPAVGRRSCIRCGQIGDSLRNRSEDPFVDRLLNVTAPAPDVTAATALQRLRATTVYMHGCPHRTHFPFSWNKNLQWQQTINATAGCRGTDQLPSSRQGSQ